MNGAKQRLQRYNWLELAAKSDRVKKTVNIPQRSRGL